MNTFGDWSAISPVGDLLVRAAHLQPDRDAIVFPDERHTYAALLDRACRVACGLSALGVRARDHVGLLAPNQTGFVEGFFGITLLGAVVVPLNTRHKAAELGYIAKHADLVAVLTTAADGEYVDLTEVLRTALPSLSRAVDPARLDLPEAPRLRVAALLQGENKAGFLGRAQLDELAAGADLADVVEAQQRTRVRDTAVILYTSGTTASPKGCMLSHEAMTRGAVERATKRFATGDRDVTWGSGPLFHIGSLAPFLGSIGALGTYLTDVYFEPGRALHLMEEEGVTAMWPWFPAVIQALIDHPSFDANRLSRLRSMLLIGPPALHERVHDTFPAVEIMQACGMTETAGIYALSHPAESRAQRTQAQGRACPGVEVRIVDPETLEDLPAGEIGEMLIRGYCVMDGYYGDSKKTAEVLDENRWLHSADLYLQTEDGSVVFKGRLKDMLKVGGENVAALEVEAFLCEHPAVRAAEVVGAPDPRLDEVPIAFVEIEPGQTLEPEVLLTWCRGRIASYKVPRAVHIVAADEWPMSATKVDKRALRRRLEESPLELAGR